MSTWPPPQPGWSPAPPWPQAVAGISCGAGVMVLPVLLFAVQIGFLTFSS